MQTGRALKGLEGDGTQAIPSHSAFGQPRGLLYLFFAEMWERFSFFGMKALLVLYLIDRWRMGDVEATTIYGAYTAMVYGASLLGGVFADRIFGLHRSLLTGGGLILAGHLALALQDHIGGTGPGVERMFLLSLALIVIGTGLFKPSVATQVGALYAKDDPRREGGFYIFYIGINLGGVIAPLICGYLGQTYGWSLGFGLAAIGMAFGLVTVQLGRPYLPDPLRQKLTPQKIALGISVPLAGIAVAFALLSYPVAVGPVLALTLGSALALVARYMVVSATREERRRIFGALSLIVGAVAFWSLSQQAGSSLNLFAARAVDLTMGPIQMRSTQTQFFNPAFVVLLAPLFALSWRWLARRGLEPHAPVKFVFGLALAGAGFGALSLGVLATPPGQQVSLWWVVLAYFLQTSGELCLVTPGLATITQLAPKRISTLMMGLWLFALSAGNFIGAKVAGLTMNATAGGTDPAAYAKPFALVALAAGIATLAMLAVAPALTRMLAQGAARPQD